MKPLKGEQIFIRMSDMDPRLVAEALPPSMRAGAVGEPSRRARRMSAFWNSGWTAAVLSGVVALGVLIAIIVAGQNGSGQPPVGTQVPLASNSQAEPETVVSEPETETEPITEGDTEPITEGDTEPETEPVFTMNTLAIDIEGKRSVYLEGSSRKCDYYENGEHIVIEGYWTIGSESMSASEIMEHIQSGTVVTVEIPQGTRVKVRYLQREGWRYRSVLTKWDEELTRGELKGLRSPEELSDTIAYYQVGVYYLHLYVRGNSHRDDIDEILAGENHVEYLIRLVVTEP